MAEIGKSLLFVAAFIALVGFLLILLSKIDFRGLPGDIYVKKDNFVFFFPIVTSLVLSILLSIVLSILFSIFRK
ncbi:MAG: DUF2905 domain-containing protein [Brevinematia bacterium]